MRDGLCKYRHIFGKENEGIHSYRIFGIAVVDTVMTIIGAIIISYLTGNNVFIVFIILMVIATLLHKLFCVETTITKIIFRE